MGSSTPAGPPSHGQEQGSDTQQRGQPRGTVLSEDQMTRTHCETPSVGESRDWKRVCGCWGSGRGRGDCSWDRLPLG